MKSYKEMKEMIEAQNKAIEYLFQTVDNHQKKFEDLEERFSSLQDASGSNNTRIQELEKEAHVQNN